MPDTAQEIEQNVERWWRIRDERAHLDADPLNPQLAFHELSSRQSLQGKLEEFVAR
jgi:hypothetical protein